MYLVERVRRVGRRLFPGRPGRSVVFLGDRSQTARRGDVPATQRPEGCTYAWASIATGLRPWRVGLRPAVRARRPPRTAGRRRQRRACVRGVLLRGRTPARADPQASPRPARAAPSATASHPRGPIGWWAAGRPCRMIVQRVHTPLGQADDRESKLLRANPSRGGDAKPEVSQRTRDGSATSTDFALIRHGGLELSIPLPDPRASTARRGGTSSSRRPSRPPLRPRTPFPTPPRSSRRSARSAPKRDVVAIVQFNRCHVRARRQGIGAPARCACGRPAAAHPRPVPATARRTGPHARTGTRRQGRNAQLAREAAVHQRRATS